MLWPSAWRLSLIWINVAQAASTRMARHAILQRAEAPARKEVGTLVRAQWSQGQYVRRPDYLARTHRGQRAVRMFSPVTWRNLCHVL